MPRPNNHIAHIRQYRLKHPEETCIRCGESLIGSIHHHFCNRCWYLRGTGKSKKGI
jgi:hypothetical protein